MSILKLVDIKKNYIVEKNPAVQALKKINLSFGENGFVGILGPSGCGKTTLLNILGGLDTYSSGDLIIEGVSTKQFTSKDWDNYRNKRVGIIFQHYNLIPHLNVLKNVELPLTLAGVSKKEREAKAKFALEQVGLLDHIHKAPNQLSGGQMQRVAIARAIVSNPHIILCDEPTGALDTATSVIVLDILKELSKNHLIIMVTHNAELADKYCSRIITMRDGEVINDTNLNQNKSEISNDGGIEQDSTIEIDSKYLTNIDNPLIVDDKNKKKKEKSRMSFFTSVSLSAKNLWTKKGRTIMVSLAGSIGIVGVSMVLALQNGFNNFMDRMVSETLASYPLTVEKYSLTNVTYTDPSKEYEQYPDDGSLHIKNPTSHGFISNNITPEYVKYVNNMKNEGIDYASIQYNYALNTTVVTTNDTKVDVGNIQSDFITIDTSPSGGAMGMMTSSSVWKELPGDKEFISSQYDLVAGEFPDNANELIVLVDSYNRISSTTLESLGYSTDSNDLNQLTDLIGSKEYKMFKNGDFYVNNADDFVILDGETPENAYQRLKSIYPDSYIHGIKLKRTADFDTIISCLTQLSSKDVTKEELTNIFSTLLSQFETKGAINIKEDCSFDIDQDKLKNLSTTYLNLTYSKPDDNYIKNNLWNDPNKLITGKPLKVVGVMRPKESVSFAMLTDGVYYSPELTKVASGTPDGDIGAYEKELIDAQNKNIELFGETKKDGTLGSGNLDPRFAYPDQIDYVLQDDLSDNLYFTLKSESIIQENIAKALDLDPNNELDKSLYEAITNITLEDILNTDLNNIINTPWISSLTKALFGYKGDSENVKKLIDIVPKLLLNTLTKEDKDFLLSLIVPSITGAFEFKSFTNINNLKQVDISSYMSARQKYGTDNEVSCITIYPSDFESKEAIINYLNAWNLDKTDPKDMVYYTDLAGTVTDMIGTIVNVISIVLVIFASISLVVSSVMIGIITYVSVIERKKEIGILRSVGARKKDVGLLFIAESTIMGFFAGLIGIAIALIAEIPINIALGAAYPEIGLGMICDLNWYLALLMVFTSVFLTFIAGLVPSYIASKKHPVECLRSE